MIYYFGQSKVDTEAATLNVAGVDFNLHDLVVEHDQFYGTAMLYAAAESPLALPVEP